MNDRNTAPFLEQDPKEVGEMMKIMTDHSSRGGKGAGGFRCRKKTYEVNNAGGRTVDSFALQDWDYKKPHLPTYARGLFTTTANGKPEISVRGYDKFFNVGEMRKTEWPNVEKNTRGPYELSVKENGCIIFIAGFDDETLIVTSKHSTGPRGDDPSANHALAGESWIDKQLQNIGKTRADLAKKLRSMNATAVAELCDDEFEEHVLEYTPENAGLYLHGINLNLPEFATYPGNQVHKFAEEWGFRKVMFVVKDTIQEVKPFLEHVAETGAYEDRDTEGFVIRCQARESDGAPWQDWFFKYKFEEPYLMYRQWRECTKAVIANKQVKIRKHKNITEEYLLYARRQFAKDHELAKRYNLNHGIIALRNGFLAEKGIKGSDIIKQELAQGGSNELDVTQNVVLLPVATIGCGKTTLAVALVKLFGWGHEQNDNITGKGNRSARFAMNTTNSLTNHPVMIADRNNHQRRERKQIVEDVRKVVPDARFVALHYVHDRRNYDNIRKVTRDRVLSRGDNHQTIQAGSKGQDEIIQIMEGFMYRFESVDSAEPPDDQLDLVIDIDPLADTRANLHTVVQKLHDEYPKLFDMPTDDQMDAAVDAALNDYKPDIKHDVGPQHNNQNRSQQKTNNKRSSDEAMTNGSTHKQNGAAAKSKSSTIEYYCIQLPAIRITSILDAVFNSETPELSRFYNHLKSSRRLQQEFHVTLIHRASSSQHKQYWDRLNDKWQSAAGHTISDAQGGTDGGTVLGNVRVHLERVVWDDRIMAIVARLPDAGDEAKGAFKSINDVAHVTIGTAAESIKPKESNDLLQHWMKEGTTGGNLREVKIKGNVTLDGVVKGIVSRGSGQK